MLVMLRPGLVGPWSPAAAGFEGAMLFSVSRIRMSSATMPLTWPSGADSAQLVSLTPRFPVGAFFFNLEPNRHAVSLGPQRFHTVLENVRWGGDADLVRRMFSCRAFVVTSWRTWVMPWSGPRCFSAISSACPARI